MTERRLHALLLSALAVIAILHGALLGWWVVDDASISFAYARNWADGHGLVPFPGGERVEGYSNFTWMALLAAGELAGLDAWWGAKILSFLFAGATVPVMAALGARAVPEQPAIAGLTAAALFATFAQAGIFTGAGLENPLFTFLLASALVLGQREAEGLGGASPPRPASAVAWLLLALTRPEGILYAAAGGAWALLAVARRRSGARYIAAWLLVFFAPFAVYHAARYAYFAWPFPMTYYAKVRTGPEVLVAWDGPGWHYLRSFWAGSGMGWFAPAALIGALGLEPRDRAERAAALVVVAGALVLLPDVAGEATGLIRTGGLWVVATAAIAASARAEPTVRGPAWTAVVLASLFAVNAGGDWMGGFRWMSLAAAPLCTLLAAGTIDLARAFFADRRAPVAVTAAVAAAAFAGVNAVNTREFLRNPEISPHTVERRARLMSAIAARLPIEGRTRILTYDMGGFLWMTDFEALDAMGLVDVAVAVQKDHLEAAYETYLFEEQRPHLIAIPVPLVARLRKKTSFLEHYLPMGPDSSVRRDLLFEPAWTGPGDRDLSFGGVQIAGFHVPSPEVAAGDVLTVELGLRLAPQPDVLARLLLADAAGGVVATWPLAPAHGWVDTAVWPTDEVFHGRYAVGLPSDLPLGRLPLGVQLFAAGAPLGEPAWLGEVRVVRPDEALAAAEADRKRAHALAEAGDCASAEAAWREARLHRAADAAWATRHASGVARASSACWLATAERAPEAAFAALVRARRADPNTPGLAEQLRAAADARVATGHLARREGRHRDALRAFTDALALEPHRSWARRYAEEARRALLAP